MNISVDTLEIPTLKFFTFQKFCSFHPLCYIVIIYLLSGLIAILFEIFNEHIVILFIKFFPALNSEILETIYSQTLQQYPNGLHLISGPLIANLLQFLGSMLSAKRFIDIGTFLLQPFDQFLAFLESPSTLTHDPTKLPLNIFNRFQITVLLPKMLNNIFQPRKYPTKQLIFPLIWHSLMPIKKRILIILIY